MSKTADVIICGAGMAGVAAAYHLAVRRGVNNVVLVDERAPLTLTSDKGTEAYRNWWPGPGDTMVRFMSRSIDLLEELAEQSDNCFELNRRGYVFLTANLSQIAAMKQSAAEISALGAGPLREHPGSCSYIPSAPDGYRDTPAGADLLLDRDLIRRHFPFVTADLVAAMHVRRAGWLNARRLGRWLLDEARAQGVDLLQDRVEQVSIAGNRIETVRLRSGLQISPGAYVLAAGPYLKQAGAMLGLDFPVLNELHGKIAFRDFLGVVPAEAPLMIWSDPTRLAWSDDEGRRLSSRQETRWLLEEFPSGVHVRPRGDTGNSEMLVIWTYDTKTQEPVWPPAFDPHYAEVLLRGLARMIPGMSAYFGLGSKAIVDGGYYCKTRENRPLIGRLTVRGAYVIGALSGYGIMGSQAAAELLAAHITGDPLPDYAPAFLLERYEQPAYRALIEKCEAWSGQL